MIDRYNRFIDMSNFYNDKITVCLLRDELSGNKRIIGINEFVLVKKISENDILKIDDPFMSIKDDDEYIEYKRLQKEYGEIKSETDKEIYKKLEIEYEKLKKENEKQIIEKEIKNYEKKIL